MYILLPKEGKKPQKILDEIDHKILHEDLEALKRAKLDVFMPKFKIEQKIDLKEVFPKMGMKLAFSSGGEFPGISNTQVHVSESSHTVKIEVNEEGTQAAAGTQISNTLELSKTFNVDRPYMFLLRDKLKSITLFAGIINKL